MKRGDQRRIELQQGLAPGADHVGASAPRPGRRDSASKSLRIGELAAPGPVDADEIGVAEGADRRRPVALEPRPQIAAGKTQEHRRPAGLRALALQRVEQLFDRITHARDLPETPPPT